MRRVQKFNEENNAISYEINKAITNASKFLPTKYGTEETNEKIARDISDGIFYGVKNMPLSQEDKEFIYNEIINRLDRMIP